MAWYEEDGARLMGFSALMKETLESVFPCPTRLWAMRGPSKEVAVCTPEASFQNPTVPALWPQPPHPRDREKKMSLAWAPHSMVVCYSTPNWQGANTICPMLLLTEQRHRAVELSVKGHTASKGRSQLLGIVLEPLPLHTDTLYYKTHYNTRLRQQTSRYTQSRCLPFWKLPATPRPIGCATEGSPCQAVLRPENEEGQGQPSLLHLVVTVAG